MAECPDVPLLEEPMTQDLKQTPLNALPGRTRSQPIVAHRYYQP